MNNRRHVNCLCIWSAIQLTIIGQTAYKVVQAQTTTLQSDRSDSCSAAAGIDAADEYICNVARSRLEMRLHDVELRIKESLRMKHTNYSVPGNFTKKVRTVMKRHPVAPTPKPVTRQTSSEASHSTVLLDILRPSEPEDTELVRDGNRVYFSLRNLENSSAYQIINATLHIFLRLPAGGYKGSGQRFDVILYKYTSSTDINSTPIGAKVAIDLARHPNGTWVSFNVLRVAQLWSREPDSNYGIMVKAGPEGQSLLHFKQSQSSDGMLLEVKVRYKEVTESAAPLVKTDCTIGDYSYKNCCRYPLTIDFEKMGWDWVLAPKRYSAYYCAGDCPLTHMPLASRAFVLQSMTSSSDGSDLGVCCAPQRLSSLKMVIVTEKLELVHTTVPNMVVESCSCH